jgi:hypothetical protein
VQAIRAEAGGGAALDELAAKGDELVAWAKGLG